MGYYADGARSVDRIRQTNPVEFSGGLRANESG